MDDLKFTNRDKKTANINKTIMTSISTIMSYIRQGSKPATKKRIKIKGEHRLLDCSALQASYTCSLRQCCPIFIYKLTAFFHSVKLVRKTNAEEEVIFYCLRLFLCVCAFVWDRRESGGGGSAEKAPPQQQHTAKVLLSFFCNWINTSPQQFTFQNTHMNTHMPAACECLF